MDVEEYVLTQPASRATRTEALAAHRGPGPVLIDQVTVLEGTREQILGAGVGRGVEADQRERSNLRVEGLCPRVVSDQTHRQQLEGRHDVRVEGE